MSLEMSVEFLVGRNEMIGVDTFEAIRGDFGVYSIVTLYNDSRCIKLFRDSRHNDFFAVSYTNAGLDAVGYYKLSWHTIDRIIALAKAVS